MQTRREHILHTETTGPPRPGKEPRTFLFDNATDLATRLPSLSHVKLVNAKYMYNNRKTFTLQVHECSQPDPWS